jgi:hypothetical protein
MCVCVPTSVHVGVGVFGVISFGDPGQVPGTSTTPTTTPKTLAMGA